MPIALPTDVVITPQMVRGLSSAEIDRLYEEIEEGADPRPTLTLKEFMVQAWPILEPRTPFVDGWHIDAICEHLTACSDGLILDLLINIPPRMSKSLLVSVMWFCWTWSYLPETRWMYSCYHEPLALRDSIKCRTLLQSPWYRANWGTRFRLKPDQNAKSRFENDHTGFRLATGVGGGQTGEGGDFIVCLEYNTLVRTETGDIAIGEIVEKRLPVRVLSYDHGSAAARWQPIEEYEQAKGRESVKVTTSRGDFIDCTSDHPFYVQGRGYVHAANLIPGDEVLTDAEAMYGMREPGGPHSLSYGKNAERDILLSGLPWGFSEGCEKQVVYGGLAGTDVRGVRGKVQRQAVAGETGWRKILLEQVLREPNEDRLAVEGGMEGVGMRLVRSADATEAMPYSCDELLLTPLCEQLPFCSDGGDGESEVGARVGRGAVFAGVSSHSATHSRARQSHLPPLRKEPRRELQGHGRASYRLRQDEQRRGQPYRALPAVPQPDTWEIESGTARMGRVTVRSVERIPDIERVYNIRVAEDHNYFAGGILLHNCDDPHNVTQAESELVRMNTVNWWCEVMSTRGNSAKKAVHVIVMQRVHERDLSGEVIARELGYESLIMPMRYEDTDEARLKVTSLGWRDPRAEDGELLCSGRMDESDLAKREKILGPYGTAGQHQQRPAPRGGGMFRREWFGEPLTELPKTQTVPGKHGAEEVKISYRYVRYWDKAGVASGKRYGDWTVGTLMARSDDGIFYVVDVVRGQWEAKERNGIILNTARADQARFGRVTIYVEQEPGLAKESTDYILRLLAGFNVRAYRSNKDKEGRVEPLQAQAAARNVKLIRGQWIRAWLDELEVYPNGSNDDQGDSAGGAFNCLSTSGKNVIERRKVGVSTRFA